MSLNQKDNPGLFFTSRLQRIGCVNFTCNTNGEWGCEFDGGVFDSDKRCLMDIVLIQNEHPSPEDAALALQKKIGAQIVARWSDAKDRFLSFSRWDGKKFVKAGDFK